MVEECLIVIPARYGSKRFPGKPLHKIYNKPMLQHVYNVAIAACTAAHNVSVIVATDDSRITSYCKENKIPCILTPQDCPSGSDRALNAYKALNSSAKYIINLQGDAPLTPVSVVIDVINNLRKHKNSVITPAVNLTWDSLDTLRTSKSKNPFSGTTVVVNDKDNAIWFSKNIIPAIRDESSLRKSQDNSPILQHIGLYGYPINILEDFCKLTVSKYEELEGLEQLRLIENSYPIKIVKIKNDNLAKFRGVDTKEDADFVSSYLEKQS